VRFVSVHRPWLVAILEDVRFHENALVAPRPSGFYAVELAGWLEKLRLSGKGLPRNVPLEPILRTPRMLSRADVKLLKLAAHRAPRVVPVRPKSWVAKKPASTPAKVTDASDQLAALAFGHDTDRASMFVQDSVAGTGATLCIYATSIGGLLVSWIPGPGVRDWQYVLLGDETRDGAMEILLENGQVDEMRARYDVSLDVARTALHAFVSSGHRAPALRWDHAEDACL
jgi:hypothetical protein